MGATALGLYLVTVLIWGSTWLAITFQLETVTPLASVIYRFALASVLLFGWCWLKKIPLSLSRREHGFMVLQGSFLFGLNYWLVYLAEQYLASGLVAVTFSTIVFFNVINARVFLRTAVKLKVVLGGLLGLVGVMMLFSRELGSFRRVDDTVFGIALALAATFTASLGNIVATRNCCTQRSVMAINAWGMLYGTLLLLTVALALGIDFSFDCGLSYVSSLLYLSVFGSIVTFAAYLKLLALIGPDKAGYIGMLIPVIALALSSVFEDYNWSLPAVIGLCLILVGNWQVMRK